MVCGLGVFIFFLVYLNTFETEKKKKKKKGTGEHFKQVQYAISICVIGATRVKLW